MHELNSSIGSALSQGHSAVIIATHAHIDTLTRKLSESGLNTGEATRQGRYIALAAPLNINKRVQECLPMHEMLCSVFRGLDCDCGREALRRRILGLIRDIEESIS